MLLHVSLRRWLGARVLGLFFTAVCCAALLVSQASAQYSTTYLVSNVPGAVHQDSNMIDAWGLAALPGSPWWVSNQNTSTSTLYNAAGAIVPLVVQIPCLSSGTPTVPCPIPGLFPLVAPFGPSGIVGNVYAFAATPAFNVTQHDKTGPSLFIFDTLDGLIVGWNPNVNLTQGVVAAQTAGAAYTGLAIWGPASGPHIYAANAAGGIDVFDSSFKWVNTFAADANPGPYSPYGIQAIGNWLFVTYSNPGVAGGIIDKCDLTTSTTAPTCTRLTDNFKAPFWLNGPWGLAWAPWNFGPLSGDLLVGNVASGQIAAIDPTTGAFKGWLLLKDGKPFTVVGLWALEFGTGEGADGHTNQLFFTAGPAAKEMPIFSEGLFGVINPPVMSSGK
jgi:uncharacterized protein (TIGR03118 family)